MDNKQSKNEEKNYYAHSVKGQPEEYWEKLEDHLELVSKTAAKNAQKINYPYTGKLIGLFHDAGKYSDKFQEYIQGNLNETEKKPEHSTAGGNFIRNKFSEKDEENGLIISNTLNYPILGHHAGLANFNSDKSGLEIRLNKYAEETNDALQKIENKLHNYNNVDLNSLIDKAYEEIKNNFNTYGNEESEIAFNFNIAVAVRTLFSCLVDADYLETEKFYNIDKANKRGTDGSIDPDTVDEMILLLNNHISSLSSKSKQSDNVAKVRKNLLEDCNEAADLEKGLFSLTAPTGSGKTVSSLSFALRHAKKYKLKRIIYVVPYTSITEQIAGEFRNILGTNRVLEHHSSASWKQDESDETYRLAAENWDIEIIVTTNVQFLESMFASKSSKCRKLHNIIDSVIIMDEAQSLPVNQLNPTIKSLNAIVNILGSSIVLCSATMPSLKYRDKYFEIGLKNVREIVKNRQEMFDTLKRVDVKKLGELNNEEVANEISKDEQALSISNTRKSAKQLFNLVKTQKNNMPVYHLSSYMCPSHRRKTITEIKDKLSKSEKCTVISTQVIEAGVDIDFPVVFREKAGIDSMMQAQGRCNREGRLSSGKFNIYDINKTDFLKIPKEIQDQIAYSKEVENNDKFSSDVFSLEAIQKYFELLYSRKNWDIKKILGDFNACYMSFNYKEVSRKYKIIEQDTISIAVPYGKGKDIIEEAKNKPEFSKYMLRKLQPYIINVYENDFNKLKNNGAIEEIHDSIYILTDQTYYSLETGIVTQ